MFDRYKAALYRLYNRELRNDPTLQGQMVLRLTIEPDGSVSFVRAAVRRDMNAPELATQVVERVQTFDFGAKEVAGDHDRVPDRLPAGGVSEYAASGGCDRTEIDVETSSDSLDAILTKAKPPKGGDAKSPV